MKKVLLEGAGVAGLGLLLALAANHLSPRRLELTRNYFPGAPLAMPIVRTNPAGPADGSIPPPGSTAARLREHGLQLAGHDQAVQFFHDPRRAVEEVIFIDARDDAHYAAGHIPGAYAFDRFHPENHLVSVVPACQAARVIVFYCGGGDCDDSEHAAIMLRDSLALPREKVFVYDGGFNEWSARGLPIERGARNSGDLAPATPPAAPAGNEGAPR